MSQQINLFNPLFMRQKKHFSAHTMLQGMGLIFGGLLLFQGLLYYQARGLDRQQLEATAMHAQIQQQVAEVSGTGARSASKVLEDEISRMEGNLKAQQDVLRSLEGGNLGNTKGYSKFLAALARQPLGGLWLTGFEVSGAGDIMSIRGRVLRADLVPQYIRQLNREPALRGRAMAELIMTRVEAPPVVAPTAVGPQRYIEFTLSTAKGDDKAGAKP